LKLLQRNSKLSPEATLYRSPGWRQCPNTGTPGSRGFAPSHRLWAGSLPGRNEPRSSNQSTYCSEVRLRRCPAGAFPFL